MTLFWGPLAIWLLPGRKDARELEEKNHVTAMQSFLNLFKTLPMSLISGVEIRWRKITLGYIALNYHGFRPGRLEQVVWPRTMGLRATAGNHECPPEYRSALRTEKLCGIYTPASPVTSSRIAIQMLLPTYQIYPLALTKWFPSSKPIRRGPYLLGLPTPPVDLTSLPVQ